MFDITLRFKFSDIPEIDPEQEDFDDKEEENHPLISKKLLYKLILNVFECTHSNNILRNIYFLLTKRLFEAFITNIFL